MPWSKRDSRSWSARSSRRWRADPPWNHGPAVAALDEPRPLAADRFGTVTFRPRCAKDKVTLLAGAHVRGGKGADGRGAPRGRLRVGRNGQGATERRGEDASRSAASGGRGGNPQHLLPKGYRRQFHGSVQERSGCRLHRLFATGVRGIISRAGPAGDLPAAIAADRVGL